jgi:putative transposase
MKRSRFSEARINGILKEQEAGVSVAELCRKHGRNERRSFYRWKAK